MEMLKMYNWDTPYLSTATVWKLRTRSLLSEKPSVCKLKTKLCKEYSNEDIATLKLKQWVTLSFPTHTADFTMDNEFNLKEQFITISAEST